MHYEASPTIDKLAFIDFFAYAEFKKMPKIMTNTMPLKFNKN